MKSSVSALPLTFVEASTQAVCHEVILYGAAAVCRYRLAGAFDERLPISAEGADRRREYCGTAQD